MPRSLTRLVREFRRFPGIGPRTAQRLAFHVVTRPRSQSEGLAAALTDALATLTVCSTCFCVSQGDLCPVCSDPDRDASTLCVVEEAQEVFLLEKAGVFNGRYHVLGGAISPLEGIGPDDLNVRQLVSRVEGRSAAEVILAMDPDPEGETTATYLADLLRPHRVKLCRIALGLPSGSRLQYSDPATLVAAFAGRREM
ncbi:MAG: recombination protein RecR [Candidatus Riflebacteria bacterium]|nr:recombination protein RecR [Candidatus Riflebacteria bacterium]